jgi:hypothetical protein
MSWEWGSMVGLDPRCTVVPHDLEQESGLGAGAVGNSG